MPENFKRWIPSLLAVGVISALIIFGEYLARGFNDLQKSNQELANEIREWRAALASSSQDSKVQPAAGADCPDTAKLSASIETLLGEIRSLPKTVAKAKTGAKEKSREPLIAGSAEAPALQLPPTASPNRLPSPETVRQMIDSMPEEKRQAVDNIMRQYSERARQRIESETDPARPDPQVIMDVMEQNHADMTAALGGILSPEELETLFPVVPGPPDFGSGTPRQPRQ